MKKIRQPSVGNPQWVNITNDLGMNFDQRNALVVGIAMGSGTDVAMETAGITLMRSNPLMVYSALDVSKRTWNKLWQNLFWAFIYNVIGIPLAVLGLLNPAVAGAAMALSSVSVVTSSLMLRTWKPKKT